MNRSRWYKLGKRLQQEWRLFPWTSALPRMAADFVLVNASMLLAFLLWFFYYVGIVQVEQPQRVAHSFKQFFIAYWLFWSLLALLVFHLSGFHTRTRGYASRYKAWVIFRAITLSIVLFVFADYFLFRGNLVPRGVAVLAWLLMLATVGGSRFAKDFFFKWYAVEPKQRPRRVKRVLVVGGGGYLGGVLVPQLLERGYETRIFDSLVYGTKAVEALKANPRVEIVPGDVRNIQAVVQAMRGCDAVLHLAGIVGDAACEENKEVAIEINRVATKMLADVARGYGISRFLFASTCSVYGASDYLMDEYSRIAPLTTYARTKADSEAILLAAKSPDFHPTILRLGTLFGLSPRVRFDLVVNLLVAKAATSGKITIFNGGQWRPFVHVHDAARAFITCLEANLDTVSGEVFNVGDYNLNFQLMQLAECIAQIIPGVQLEHIQNEDKRNYRVSFDKIRSRLGFACEKTLEDGVREVYQLIVSGEIKDHAGEEFSNRLFLKTAAPKEVQLEEQMRLLEASQQ